MEYSSDSDVSDLDELVSKAYTKLEDYCENQEEADVHHLSPTVRENTSVLSARSKLQVTSSSGKKLKPELSSKLVCLLPKPDIAAMCSESLDAEISSSILLQPGAAKLKSLPSEQSRRQIKRDRRKTRDQTKGSSWYNLPANEMTEEKKNDLMVLQMRKVLDPKRFYKGSDFRGALPKYFQMGTVIESPADFYSGRIPNKKRKTSLVDELLNDAEFRRYNKKKYEEIQASQQTTRRSKAHRHMKRQKNKK